MTLPLPHLVHRRRLTKAAIGGIRLNPKGSERLWVKRACAARPARAVDFPI